MYQSAIYPKMPVNYLSVKIKTNDEVDLKGIISRNWIYRFHSDFSEKGRLISQTHEQN